MSIRKRTAIHGPPLTTAESTGYGVSSYEKEFKRGKPIVCSVCGKGGGTLVRIDDHYKHINC